MQHLVSEPVKAALREKRKAELQVGSLLLPDGRTLAYHVDGDLVPGKPVILLLHGMISCGAMWLPEARPVRCAFVAPDRPGYAGSSDPPAGGYSYAAFAWDMAALMDHLGVGEFSVIGHSSGGPYALAVAAVLGAARGRVRAAACLGGDTEYCNPDPRTPVDPVSRDMLRCFAGVLRRIWLRVHVPLIVRCGRFFFWPLQCVTSRWPGRFVRGMLTKEELPLWEENEGDNFFQLSLLEATRSAVLPSDVRRGMGGMIHDFASERARRFDFEAAGVDCKLLFWTGELDAPCLQPSLFNHEVLFPKSELRVIPGTGHFGVLASETFDELVGAVLAAGGHAEPGAVRPKVAAPAAASPAATHTAAACDAAVATAAAAGGRPES